MELRGRLVNATTNAAVYPGAVLVLGTALNAQTNEKGDFAISSGSLPPGEALTIMASGYQFESKVLSYPLAGSTFKADFKIELEVPIRLDRYVRQTANEERPAFVASGRIVDEEGRGLPGVKIMAANIRGETFTNAGGDFSFRIDQIRPLDQTELWFSKSGYITANELLPELRKKRYRATLASAVVLAKSWAKPPKNLSIKFIDASNRPLPGVTLRVAGKSIGETDLLGLRHLTLGENQGESLALDYFYKFDIGGMTRTIDGDTLIKLDAIDDLVEIQMDPFHQTLWIRTYSGVETLTALPRVRIAIGNESRTTNYAGKLRLQVARPQIELVASKEGFEEARIRYEIKGMVDSLKIVLKPIPPPPPVFVVTVRDSSDNNKVLAGAVVQLGDIRDLTNSSGEVIFENPQFPAVLSARKSGYENWYIPLEQKLDHYAIRLKRKPNTFRLSFIDSLDQSIIPHPDVISLSGNAVKTDGPGDVLIFDPKQGDRMKVRAEGYREKTITLPDTLGEKLVPLARLIKTGSRKPLGSNAKEGFNTKDSKRQSPKRASLGSFFDNLAIFIGPGIGRFVRGDATSAKPRTSRNFPLLNLYLEKPVPISYDSVNAITTTFRIPLSLQTFSRELDNLESGLDFSWRRSLLGVDAGLHAGLRASYYDLQTAGVNSDWFSPLISTGCEFYVPRKSLSFFGTFIVNLGFRYSHDFFAFDHYRLSLRQGKITPLKNIEAHHRRDAITFILKTKAGVFRLGYSSLGPEIRANRMRLRDIAIFYVSYDFKNAWLGD
ncbi:MAG: carboxypeptidase-like regulatory domain-containing protein [bacterium]